LLTTFELDSNPFKVDELLYIDIQNNCPNFWHDKMNVYNKAFKIINIEHSLRQFYNPKESYLHIFTVIIYVNEIID
jgi:hypothetical protein